MPEHVSFEVALAVTLTALLATLPSTTLTDEDRSLLLRTAYDCYVEWRKPIKEVDREFVSRLIELARYAVESTRET